jgi:hypothetical protein
MHAIKLTGIVVNHTRTVATIHYTTHSVNIHSDQDVTKLVHELFLEPTAKQIRSEEDTAIFTLPEIDENGNVITLSMFVLL